MGGSTITNHPNCHQTHNMRHGLEVHRAAGVVQPQTWLTPSLHLLHAKPKAILN